MPTAESTYNELVSSYDKIQEFFNSNQFGPQQDAMIAKSEKLGEEIIKLNRAIIADTSKQLNARSKELEVIAGAARQAKQEIDTMVDHIATAAKVASQIDKLITEITKLV